MTVSPYPVVVGFVDLDIQGCMTFTFHSSPEVSPDVEYSAVFAPIAEPSTAFMMLAAFGVVCLSRTARVARRKTS